MADPAKVRRAVRAMAVAHKRSFKNDEEEQMAIAAFAHGVKSYSDDAVNFAANEWVATMKWYPTVVEFVELTAKHQAKINDARKALSPAADPVESWPVGKPGSENVAATIVLQRMFDAVAKQSPTGYLGRARGYLSDAPVPGMHRSQRDLGHEFNVKGEHASSCARCHALATIAYEAAVDFPDSALTWDRW